MHGEISQAAIATNIDGRGTRGVGLDPGREGQLAAVARIEWVAVEDRLEDVAGGAVGAGEVGALAQQRTTWRLDVEGGGAEADRGDAERIEGVELPRIGDAVLVLVAPDTQGAKDAIGDGDREITVVVEVAQHLEAGDAGAAEHLSAVADQPVAVEVADEEAVIAADPTVELGEAVDIDVEMHAALIGARRLQPVAVEVEDDRVLGQLPLQQLGEIVDGVEDRDQLAPDAVEDADRLPAIADDAEQHVEVADLGDAEDGVVDGAEGVVLDDHCAVECAVAGPGRRGDRGMQLGIDDELAAGRGAVPDEGQQPVAGDLAGIGFEAEERVGAAGQRHAVHLQDVLAPSIHDEGAGMEPEDVGRAVRHAGRGQPIEAAAIELAHPGGVEEEVLALAAGDDGASAAANDDAVFALLALHDEAEILAGRRLAAEEGELQVLVADLLAGEDVARVLDIGDVVTGAELEVAIVLVVVATRPAAERARHGGEVGMPDQVVLVRHGDVLGAGDPQRVVADEVGQHRVDRRGYVEDQRQQDADRFDAAQQRAVRHRGLGRAVHQHHAVPDILVAEDVEIGLAVGRARRIGEVEPDRRLQAVGVQQHGVGLLRQV